MGQRGACAQKRLFDVHGHFSLTYCPVAVVARLAAPRADRGIRRWTGATPLFCLPGSAQRGRLMCTGVPSPGEGRSVPSIPGGKVRNDTPGVAE